MHLKCHIAVLSKDSPLVGLELAREDTLVYTTRGTMLHSEPGVATPPIHGVRYTTW